MTDTMYTWYPDATFVYWMQVQECIRLWRECGNGAPPEWLTDLEHTARSLHAMARSMGQHRQPIEVRTSTGTGDMP